MADAKHPDDDARWAQLLEAEAYGELSEAERVELEQLATRDNARHRELQLLHALSKLEPAGSDRSEEDHQLIEDVLEQHHRGGRRRRIIGWSAAAVVLIPLGAAAAYSTLRGGSNARPIETAPTVQPSVARSVTGVKEDEHLAKPDAAPERRDPPAPAPARRAPSPSAAELLARAQKARSARYYGQAARAYAQLLRRYPRSGEADLAQVSLAQLQLAQGKAAAALAGFDAYERSGGALAQEAHYGKIQALRALRRTAEERREIQRFLAVYPDSLQVAALKRRLEAADGNE
jgi:TolA-binding protein